MTLSEFVNTYNGTKVGNGQCVDLILQYQSDVQNLTPTWASDAVNYYRDYYTEPFLYNNYDLITYTGTELSQAGDLIVWNENQGGGYGHIAIDYQNFSNSSFDSFDQNWSVVETCSIETHTYTNVLGYLRLKTTPPVPTDITKSSFKWVLYAKKLRERRRGNARKRF